MTTLILLTGALQVAALVARLLRKRWQAALLLAAASMPPLIAYLINLVQRAPLSPTELKMVLAATGAFALALFSLGRPLWIVFWLGWLLNAWVVAVLFYVAFFWHPFA